MERKGEKRRGEDFYTLSCLIGLHQRRQRKTRGRVRGGEGKVSPCEDKRRSRGEKLLHCVREEMSRWKEEKDKRGRQRRRCL